MMPIKDNRDVACFLVTKHSWKGKYKRIFSIGSAGITTYNPSNLEVTNKWEYADFISVQPANRNQTGLQEFSITMKKDRKVDTMKFSSEHRSHLLTEALRFRNQFAEKPKEILRYQAYKHHWSDTRLPVVLEVTPYSLDQLDPATNLPLASYCFKDFEGLLTMKDYTDGFVIVCGGFGRLHLFASHRIEEIKRKVVESAMTNLGIGIKVLKEPIKLDEFVSQRLGKYSGDEHITSVSEFTVHKISSRHSEPQRRTLCLSDTCLLERDPQTYNICTLRPLADVFALVRDDANPQLFTIQYLNGEMRSYTTTDRDSLLASVLDGVRASGNRDVHVTMSPIARGKRLGPLNLPVEEEVETCHLKFIQQTPGTRTFAEILERFNANVPYSGLHYSMTQDDVVTIDWTVTRLQLGVHKMTNDYLQGLFTENKDKIILAALNSLVSRELETNVEVEAQFHAIRRLVASKVGFMAFTSLPGFREAIGNKVVKALKRQDSGVTQAAIDCICALMQPMLIDDCDLRQEQLNKSSLLSSNKFLESLLEMWINHVNHGTGALVVSAMLDLLTFALCVPYSETTDGKHFDNLLEMVASRGRSLFKLFQHPSLAIVKGAGLIMRAIIEEGAPEVAAKMQELALAEGALPRHLLNSLFTVGSDGRMLTHRQLCRHLVGLWVTGHPTAMGLLKRIVPCGLLNYLSSEDQVPDSFLEEERLNNRDNLKMAIAHASKNKKGPQWIAIERQMRVMEKHLENALQHWGARIGFERREKIKERPIVLRKRRERIKSEANWKLFYYKFNQDHTMPNLIWNHKTREELRTALENEIRAFASDKDLSGGTLIAWNHREFEVQYQCLSDEVKIGDYYLRLLLEKDCPDSPIRKSYEFFNDLYHRFLLTTKVEMKCLCLQAMTIVYGRYYEDIGPFSDTKYIIGMLDRCTDRTERDRLVMFINKLILHRRNVKDIMDQNGVRALVDLLTLAHLHTSRAVVPTQTNVIEAGPEQERAMEKEWYYNEADKRKGPISLTELKQLYAANKLNHKTKVWAQGLDGWRMISQVPQLKWSLVAKGSPVLNESELATLILNILITMCEYYPSRDADNAVIRPLPRVKRLLSELQCLQHVVQLLLTFDPVLVERVATLLCQVMRDNPDLSKIYLTGVFYFILMYTGSNVLPIATFLQLTHAKQAFRGDDANSSSDIMQRSILGQLLPDAMVSYLENHGAEKFAQIFLGDFDTPEAIWNSEMRRMLIEKIAAHIVDFTPRLRSHTMARYQYIAIPAVRYPQLEKELFCQIFYLRHLCDTVKFPLWPIPNPVHLLKDVLDAWKKEVEKKPPIMTVDEAYRVLGLPSGKQHNEAIVRKSYYKLAQMYHPDKNPQGRDKFEAVNQAYEFLCSRSCWSTDGPNPDNIVLILRTQSILFERYSEELRPYKYAGYPQLIKTIKLETEDDRLFSKSAPLLAAASELAYHTVHCSALNAEELRREGGLDVLLDAYTRCVSVLNKSSKRTDVAVQVCTHVTRCFSVAGTFRGCREKMVELGQLIKDLCRILHFKHLTELCSVATECISSLATDSILQMQLLQAGALWHLLLFMFNYDYTLEEGGVERNQEENRQEVANNLAKLAIRACARLGGYMSGENETPVNPVTVAALESLLTPYLARQLARDKPEEILKTLNSNSSNPYLIWDNATRAELIEYLENMREERVEGGANLEHDFSDFAYSAHSGELVIGEIFVKIYNEQPTFPIENPKGFTIDLLDFLSKSSDYLASLGSMTLTKKDEEKLRCIVMALEALRNVIKNNPGVEMQCIGHFGLVFGLLSCYSFKAVQKGALEVISNVTRNNECVNDIAANEVIVHLLLALNTLKESQLVILETLYALMSTTKIVKDALGKGAVVYALDLFCNSSNIQVRECAAELLAKMSSDKLAGPKVKLDLSKFLPRLFSEAIRDAPKQCVHMFETKHENPELIWDEEAKARVSRIIAELKDENYSLQRRNPSAIVKLPESQNNVDFATNEPVVGGVYLRLFIASPAWTLRKPKEFLSELMDTTLLLMSRENIDVRKLPLTPDMLELTTQALVCLLQAQPTLADQVPSLGHIPRLCRQMAVRNSQAVVYKSAILVLHQLATSEICISSICQTDCISPLKLAMQSRRDMIAVACETLNRLFSTNEDRLIKQALEAEMVPYLLNILEGRLDSIDNPATTKAQIVKALKAMTRSLLLGEKVNAILEKSSVWAEYKDQKHDLFISNAPTAGYLTGGIPVSAGYLTAGPGTTLPTAPPPVDKEDRLLDSV